MSLVALEPLSKSAPIEHRCGTPSMKNILAGRPLRCLGDLGQYRMANRSSAPSSGWNIGSRAAPRGQLGLVHPHGVKRVEFALGAHFQHPAVLILDL